MTTREELIEAGAGALTSALKRFPIDGTHSFSGTIGYGASVEELVESVLDTILPILAQDVLDESDRMEAIYARSNAPVHYGLMTAYEHIARFITKLTAR